MYRKTILAALAPVTMLINGCVSFQAHNLPTIPPREAQVARAEKVKVFTQWKYQNDGKTYNNSYDNEIENELRKSGCCEIVSNASEATLLLTGTTNQIDTDGLFQIYFEAISLAAIPTWSTNTVRINVTAFDGEKQNYYSFSDSYTEVVWLPFIVVAPFTSRPNLTDNINRNIIIALKKDGYL